MLNYRLIALRIGHTYRKRIGRSGDKKLYDNNLNWYAQEEASGYFKREWTPVIDNLEESQVKLRIRAWDLAWTMPSESSPYPDYTAGVLIAKLHDDTYVIEDVIKVRKRAGEVELMIVEVTADDRSMYKNYRCLLPEDPSSGKVVKLHMAKIFDSYKIPVSFSRVASTKGKLESFKPFSSSSENGLVKVLRADWNNDYFKELEQFDGKRSSSSRKDDQVDATSLGFNSMSSKKELPKLKPSMFKMPSVFG